MSANLKSGSGVPPLNEEIGQSRDGSATLVAPTGRREIAQGKERSVASKHFFEQMKGRGVRVVSDTEMEQVNPGIKRKTRYVIVDAVGVCERVQTESRPLEKKPTVSFEKLLDAAALGTTEVAAVESLAGRLARRDREISRDEAKKLAALSGTLLRAIDPEAIAECTTRKRGAEPQEIAPERHEAKRYALRKLILLNDARKLGTLIDGVHGKRRKKMAECGHLFSLPSKLTSNHRNTAIPWPANLCP